MLAAFKFEKARDAMGREIAPAAEFISGAVRYKFFVSHAESSNLHSDVLEQPSEAILLLSLSTITEESRTCI